MVSSKTILPLSLIAATFISASLKAQSISPINLQTKLAGAPPSLRLTNVTTTSVRAHLERFCNPSNVLYSTHLHQGERMVEVDVDLEHDEPMCLVVQRSQDVNPAMGVHQFSFARTLCEIVIADGAAGFGFEFASNCSLAAYDYTGSNKHA